MSANPMRMALEGIWELLGSLMRRRTKGENRRNICRHEIPKDIAECFLTIRHASKIIFMKTHLGEKSFEVVNMQKF